MDILEIFCSGIVATTLMTSFSYIVAAVRKSQFREPELLNILLCRSKNYPKYPGRNNFIGWVIHYLIGWIFVFVMALLFTYTKQEPILEVGAYLGFIAGIIGISGWRIFFYLSNDPPEIEFDLFYFQLIIAHIIFGIGAALVFIYF